VSDGARIEPRTVETSALAVRRSNHSARSHTHLKMNFGTTLCRSVFFFFTVVKYCVRGYPTFELPMIGPRSSALKKKTFSSSGNTDKSFTFIVSMFSGHIGRNLTERDSFVFIWTIYFAY
jgi:hypothetical protein